MVPKIEDRKDFDEHILNVVKEQGVCSSVKNMLKELNNWNAQDKLGNTLMHYAAKYDNGDMIQFLIESGSDIAIVNNLQETPLMVAADNNSRKVMVILLRSGANIFDTNVTGKSALSWYFCEGNLSEDEIVFMLHSIRKKCCNKYRLIATILLECQCPLYNVVLMNNLAVTRIMLERGCAVDTANANKQTALHLAVMWVDAKLVNLLLRHDANPNAMDDRQKTPLSYLYEYNTNHSDDHMRILNMFIVQKAALYVEHCVLRTSQIDTVLEFGNEDAIEALLFADLDWNEELDSRRNMPLHILAKNKNPEVFEILDNPNFNVNAVNRDSETPLSNAIACANVCAVKYLLKNGADVNAVQNDRSILCRAVEACSEYCGIPRRNCVVLLLQYGADAQRINQTCSDTSASKVSSTVLEVARQKSSYDIGKIIIEHLVLGEKSGRKITDRIRSNIISDETFQTHYDYCRQRISKDIGKRVSLLDLLIASDGQFETYMRDPQMALKMDCFCSVKRSNLYYIKKILLRKMAIRKIMKMEKEKLENLITD